MDLFLWLLSAIALYGALLHMKDKVSSYYYWIIANSGYCVSCLYTDEPALAFLFATYVFVCIENLRESGKIVR